MSFLVFFTLRLGYELSLGYCLGPMLKSSEVTGALRLAIHVHHWFEPLFQWLRCKHTCQGCCCCCWPIMGESHFAIHLGNVGGCQSIDSLALEYSNAQMLRLYPSGFLNIRPQQFTSELELMVC